MDKSLLFVICRGFFKYSLTLFCAFLFSFSFAQVKFSASANDKTIGKSEYLQVQFTIENAANVESITPPSFKNFAVVSGPNHQSSMSVVNGNIKQSLSIGFVLQPLSAGNFTIGAATAKADGKQYHSNPLAIQVTALRSSHGAPGGTALSPFGNITLDFPTEPVTHQFDDYILRKGENIAEKVKRNLFIRIEVSKKSCYVGEPIIATYKLYTRLKSESNVLKAPSFNGFSVSELEMPDNNSLRTESYNGREYNVYTLRKVQLYPLQPGKLSLEPVEVKNRVTFLKAEFAGRRGGDPFYEMLRDFANENAPSNTTEQQVITITCDTLNIMVKPLPEINKPVSFKGAVGNFKISSALEKNNITTDDAGTMKVVISGAGNVQLINAPVISWPTGIEGFESKAAENLDKFSVPMKGDKVFVYPFTVNDPGDYTIPAVNFSYFDVNSQTYKTTSTQPLALHVVKGSGNAPKIFAHNNKNPADNNWYDVINSGAVYIIVGILFLSLAFILFLKNSRQKKESVIKNNQPEITEAKIEDINEFIIPANPLADAEEELAQKDPSRFYKVLDVSLHNYLSEKLQVPVEELTKKKINERMDKCNVGVGTTLLVNSLLEDIEVNLYAPVTSEIQMQEVYEKASEVVSLLDKQI
ncbi:MAG TPA: BatD family protein [Chitinophagaceae bacterium]|nr:BatD family protein [Chitinophagaceae bacterium]